MSIISRNEAAKILNVSTRTLDRYIRQKRITAVRRGRNLEFMMDEIQELAKHAPELIEKSRARKIHEALNSEEPTGKGEGIYRKLYEETSVELKKKQELLQGANYRVGQLEAKLQNMIPMLEYKKEREEKEKLKKTVEEKDSMCKVLGKHVEIERYNKRVYIILFALTLGLLPLALLIQHFLT